MTADRAGDRALDPAPARLVDDLPLCELHVHLEGTLEPELLLELAARNGVELATTTVEEVRATHVFDSLASFLAVCYPAMDVLQTRRDFTDLATAHLARAAGQGVRRAEVFFDPQAHTSRGVPFEVVVEGLLDAVDRAPRELGIDAELIMCFLRDHPVASAEETLTASLPHADRIIGVGLDSDERDHPPAEFAAVFARAREAGYRLTMHCDWGHLPLAGDDQPGRWSTCGRSSRTSGWTGSTTAATSSTRRTCSPSPSSAAWASPRARCPTASSPSR